MSKYIKLEDAIEQVKTEFYGGGYQEWLEISIDNLINRIANLPTIEVSEDCISREQVRAKLDYISYAEKDPISIAKRIVDNAPSVVPTQTNANQRTQCVESVGRAEGEWQITDAYPHNVYCSECHKKFAQTHWGVWEDGSLPRNYCPNCGCDMRGGSTNER